MLVGTKEPSVQIGKSAITLNLNLRKSGISDDEEKYDIGDGRSAADITECHISAA